ncbi:MULTISPECIES: M14 family zinc carboxypeptidase [unclassified Motilimonas]|uniref:M14 family zinc carboxypeptidase n=1 Tax=Motilimonas TaxID=1914248 RepID=UPI001E5E4366|nr:MULTISPECIES: M14 family zinc carboxypeptidase [unclassified Motilimonas]MCE0557681.1 DUF2817 domain-containing protein [Motilimonas sp. E26]MDO6527200.1 DUF2817 domain-containing protein [Motilimonas sp. 1_MG-2023]
MYSNIPELAKLEQLIELHKHKLKAATLGFAYDKEQSFPIHGIELGSQSNTAPTVIFVGGVHGVERIGSQVVIAFLSSLLERLEWDLHFQQLFTQVRVAFLPLLNPVGFFNNTRSNGQGIDLMRNAPVDAICRTTPLVGGHRISHRLPWFRGKEGLAPESQILVDFVSDLIKRSSITLSLDAHSGFGLRDYLWFPFAGNIAPYPMLAQTYGLMNLFDNTYPYHAHYKVSPQSHFYTTHGDLWDYLSKQHKKARFIPLTLEMGSWLWVKKNPRQLFNFAGFFNPQKQHRQERILRRHTVLMDFLIQAAYSSTSWWPEGKELTLLNDAAKRLWYTDLKR